MAIEPRELGEQGLALALARLQERLEERGGFHVPLIESLHWIFGLDEVHRRIVDGHGSKGDFEALKAGTDAGKTLLALTWARNFPAHQLLTVVHPDMGVSGVLGLSELGRGVLGASYGSVIWNKEKGLIGWATRERGFYKDLVEGKAVLEPLVEVQTYLVSLP
jgi:hypothetical protein